jgi:hypothetical protein
MLFQFFSYGDQDIVPRSLSQVAKLHTVITRHHYHHFPTLSPSRIPIFVSVSFSLINKFILLKEISCTSNYLCTQLLFKETF